MTTAVLVFHPHMDQSRANKALMEAAERAATNGADIIVRDEYAAYPDGRIDVRAEQELLGRCDRIVLQFPMYWYSSPALLKQWQDEVLAFGWAYGSADAHAMRGKRIDVATTTGGDAHEYEPDGPHGCAMAEVLTPLRVMADYVGATFGEPFVVHDALPDMPDDALEDAARRYVEFLVHLGQAPSHRLP